MENRSSNPQPHYEQRADPVAVAGLVVSATTLAIQAADSAAVKSIVSKVTGSTGGSDSASGGQTGTSEPL